jgi:molybdopterin-guanine dinucleotide biosynthesis protein A
MPFIEPALLKQLLALRGTSKALFFSRGRNVGFPFLLPRGSLSVVAQQLERGELSIHSLAKKLKPRRIVLTRKLSQQLRNVNTPRELKVARATWNAEQGL